MSTIQKEVVAQASKLYNRLEVLDDQIAKVTKEAKESTLVTLHLSHAVHVDVSTDLVVGFLQTEADKVKAALVALGCEV